MITHFKAVVITLQIRKTITDDPPMEVPTITNVPYFGTMAPWVFALHNSSGNKVANDKQNSREKTEKIEEKVNGDQLMEMQEFNIPMVYASLIGYEIDMLFECDAGEEDTEMCVSKGKWYSL